MGGEKKHRLRMTFFYYEINKMGLVLDDACYVSFEGTDNEINEQVLDYKIHTDVTRQTPIRFACVEEIG